MTDTGETATTTWSTATVVEVDRPDGRLARIRLDVAGKVEHLPGQHYVVRLRAPDDYTAQRSYSIASDPGDPLVELMVERMPDGEVSGHLHDVAEPGDVVEVRGPLGGWFTWEGDVTAIAVGGGFGIVPIVSMVRYAARLGLADRLRVVAVGRTLDELPYAEELLAAGAFVALTRENLGSRVAAPPYPEEVRDLLDLPTPAERAYVCGSVGFASFATRVLGEAGMLASAVRVEQFGVTS
ncbi:FAD-binding oxidoreductase [Nocardioides sp.]|uniref:FAD-binding oxidoreductase n=1 Tax=Nocardioides sp. TaxID=35761 RepID=UPI00271C7FE5|nr:FAD-binding oxidoreductase [Nocardioides sp.]MDO9458396.1 FAD-binding oxidoreductase [Nocardioides sp.]